ncbi:hypothetical protein PU630_15555 [Microbacterium horticulturae]|uniref:Uncharacterized protein n=1 Tax=Microbacterium horticulturae TaxID=3028316 RepID=A0ABY8C090_9MICO|nr:hypothetical protein [Microbacterium sp. KACC 23027]WEG08640.1 hypothetical protein PU630_15555 [Microbacterium sp. KACC 23027]
MEGKESAHRVPVHVSELLVQEYVSLRAESLSAKQNQQTILQWTLATVGIVIAASVTAATGLHDMDSAARLGLSVAVTLLTGVLTPALVSCAFGIWLGELNRMERAGHFLRLREEVWSAGYAKKADPASPQSGGVLLWESLLADHPHSQQFAKNRIGGMASVALFLMLATSAVVAGLILALGRGGLVEQQSLGVPACVVWVLAGLWVITFLVTNLCIFWGPLKKLGRASKPSDKDVEN